MSNSGTQTMRFTFITPDTEHIFQYAPIGWDVVTQDIERSKTSDGIVLNITQNLQFVKTERQFLIDLRNTKGVDADCQIKVEKKIYNTYEVVTTGYVDIATLHVEKITATVSYTDNSFDNILRANANEKYELNRSTSINDEAISELVPDTMLFKHREIFLRSEMDVREPYDENHGIPALTPYISLPLSKIVSSDELIVHTYPHSDQTYFVGYNPGDTTKTFPEAQQFFYLDNDRLKTVKLGFDISFNFQFAPSTVGASNQFVHIMIQKSFKELNGTFTPVELFTLEVLNGDGGTGIQLLEYSTGNEPIEFELDDGECLALVYNVPQNLNGETKFIDPIKNQIVITEDSFFEPENSDERFVDCITLYNAFERVIEIMAPDVVFKSDHITENWNDIVLFSGETARHIYFDEEKAVLGTVSFDMLFRFLFTLNPVAFGIKNENGVVTIEVEDIEHFFDDEISIELGTLSDITRTINTDKIYTRIVIGNEKSGENEDVFGLQAMNTVNTFGLPVVGQDNTYEATNEFRTDPNELELCYRKQYSLYPDTDTRYDKDLFAVDCNLVNSVYIVREWQEDFSTVSGIYSINSAYNYRLTPMNCILRHGKNFKQEYMFNAYDGKSVLYLSTIGNVALKTQIIGGDLLQENDNVLLSVFENAIFTSNTISGGAFVNHSLVSKINAIENGKANYYKTVTYLNEKGIMEYGFVYSFKIDDKIESELVEKYGI